MKGDPGHYRIMSKVAAIDATAAVKQFPRGESFVHTNDGQAPYTIAFHFCGAYFTLFVTASDFGVNTCLVLKNEMVDHRTFYKY
jgi:hypothetical protein